MKNTFLLWTLLLAVITATAQTPAISTNKLGALKLGEVNIDSVNAVLDKKITLPKYSATADNNYRTDTLDVLYKSLTVKLSLIRYYDVDDKGRLKGNVHCAIGSIYCADKNIKTKSGIALGDDKFDIIKKLDGSVMRVSPDYNYDPVRKEYSLVILYDSGSGNELMFYFLDNKLYAMSCQEGGEE